jgi:hypothetical protein
LAATLDGIFAALENDEGLRTIWPCGSWGGNVELWNGA